MMLIPSTKKKKKTQNQKLLYLINQINKKSITNKQKQCK